MQRQFCAAHVRYGQNPNTSFVALRPHPRCKPVSVSVGRLMEFLNVLGQDVEVTVRPAGRRRAGDMSVIVQAA